MFFLLNRWSRGFSAIAVSDDDSQGDLQVLLTPNEFTTAAHTALSTSAYYAIILIK